MKSISYSRVIAVILSGCGLLLAAVGTYAPSYLLVGQCNPNLVYGGQCFTWYLEVQNLCTYTSTKSCAQTYCAEDKNLAETDPARFQCKTSTTKFMNEAGWNDDVPMAETGKYFSNEEIIACYARQTCLPYTENDTDDCTTTFENGIKVAYCTKKVGTTTVPEDQHTNHFPYGALCPQ
jgi:hypothetical protein